MIWFGSAMSKAVAELVNRRASAWPFTYRDVELVMMTRAEFNALLKLAGVKVTEVQ